MPFSLKVYVDPKTALLAGRTAIREQQIEVGDDDVASLEATVRYELAIALEDHPPGRGFTDEGETLQDAPLAEPTFAAVVALLRARHAARVGKSAALQKAADEAAAERARQAEIAAAAQAEKERNATVLKLALHRWIERNGDVSQKARFKEGFLSEEEILTAVEEKIFEPLEDLERYRKIERVEACACGCYEEVKLTCQIGSPLSEELYDRFGEIRALVPKDAQVEVREHSAKCPGCSCGAIVRHGIFVRVEWQKHWLAREYAI